MKAKNKPRSKNEDPLFCSSNKLARVLGKSRMTPHNWHRHKHLNGVKIGPSLFFPIAETAEKLGIDPALLR